MAKEANPKALTGKAETKDAMEREAAKGRGISKAEAARLLVAKGYAKLCAETRYMIDHPHKPAKRKAAPKRKVARKAKRAKRTVREASAVGLAAAGAVS